MTVAKYNQIGESITTLIENQKRKEILVKQPQYSQTFDISTLLEFYDVYAELKGQPYRIFLPDGTIKLEGMLTDRTDVIRTDDPVKVRCEIGAGKWKITEDSYDEADVNKIKELIR